MLGVSEVSCSLRAWKATELAATLALLDVLVLVLDVDSRFVMAIVAILVRRVVPMLLLVNRMLRARL